MAHDAEFKPIIYPHLHRAAADCRSSLPAARVLREGVDQVIVCSRICSGSRCRLLRIVCDCRGVTSGRTQWYRVPTVNIASEPRLAVRDFAIEVAGISKHDRLCLLALEWLRLFVLKVNHHNQHAMLSGWIARHGCDFGCGNTHAAA